GGPKRASPAKARAKTDTTILAAVLVRPSASPASDNARIKHRFNDQHNAPETAIRRYRIWSAKRPARHSGLVADTLPSTQEQPMNPWARGFCRRGFAGRWSG